MAEKEAKEFFTTRDGVHLIRVVPGYRALEKSGLLSEALPYENIRELIKDAETISQVHCPCQRRARACENDDNRCIQLNSGARYGIVRGTGKELSYEEAIRLLDKFEEEGLVHQLGNARRTNIVCNCCKECCLAFASLIKYDRLREGCAKSRYQAAVDQELCNGCQVCVDRCGGFGAMSMVKVAGSKKLKAESDPELCMGCGACVTTCPVDAIRLVVARPPEYIPV